MNMSRRRSVSRIASSAGPSWFDPARDPVAAGDGAGAEPADEQPSAAERSDAAKALPARTRANVRRDDRLDPAADVEVTHHLHPLWFGSL